MLHHDNCCKLPDTSFRPFTNGSCADIDMEWAYSKLTGLWINPYLLQSKLADRQEHCTWEIRLKRSSRQNKSRQMENTLKNLLCCWRSRAYLIRHEHPQESTPHGLIVMFLMAQFWI